MIESSFVMMPGIGPKKEELLWKNGIFRFEDFIYAEKLPGISKRRLPDFQIKANEIQSEISCGDIHRIAERMPESEKWRLLSAIDSRFAALDIESIRTEGRDVPVVLTVCKPDGKNATLVRGENLHWRNLDRLLGGVDFILTFNGSSFDLPLLASNGFRIDGPVHVDLRRFSRKAGFFGGLKGIEKEIGIGRPRDLEFSTNSQTTFLWNLWISKGSKRAIDLLIGYNRQDAATLIPLSRLIYQRLHAKKLKCLEYNIGT